MAANTWINAAGTWRKAANAWFNDAGTWRKAKNIWFNDAGTWRKVFSWLGINPAFAPNLVNISNIKGSYSSVLNLASDGTASIITVGNNGQSAVTNTMPEKWADPAPAGVGSSWNVYFSHVGANLILTGGTENAWLSLATDPGIGFRNSNSSSESEGTLTMQFSLDNGATVAATRYAYINVGYRA